MTKVSVLVAIYNAEKYLEQCLDSLLRQTLKDIEIICVDDASADASADILRKYAENDERIKPVFLSENKGQAHARNIALEIASGQYVCFLDSDDWLADDALELCSSILDGSRDADAVLFKLMMYYSEDKCSPYPMIRFRKMSGREAFIKSLNWNIHGVYMIRTELHKQLPYDDSLIAYSDDNTTRTHYLASRFVYCSEGRYYYRQHESSVTHAVTERRFDHMRANELMKEKLVERGEDKRIIDLYENERWMVLIDSYMFYYLHRRTLGREAAAKGLKEIRRIRRGINRNVLDDRAHKFGYRVCSSWTLFRLQEEVYFTLRGIMGRNKI